MSLGLVKRLLDTPLDALQHGSTAVPEPRDPVSLDTLHRIRNALSAPTRTMTDFQSVAQL